MESTQTHQWRNDWIQALLPTGTFLTFSTLFYGEKLVVMHKKTQFIDFRVCWVCCKNKQMTDKNYALLLGRKIERPWASLFAEQERYLLQFFYDPAPTAKVSHCVFRRFERKLEGLHLPSIVLGEAEQPKQGSWKLKSVSFHFHFAPKKGQKGPLCALLGLTKFSWWKLGDNLKSFTVFPLFCYFWPN